MLKYVTAAADNIDPAADFKAFRDYYTKMFPNVPLNDFVNGPYSMDAELRKQWEAIDDFPPYDFAVDRGKQMFGTPFKNGKTYGDCFPDKGIGIRQNYPYFDDKEGKVNGAGRLIWRLQGKPAYDRASIFAEYRGAMKDGRRRRRRQLHVRPVAAYRDDFCVARHMGLLERSASA